MCLSGEVLERLILGASSLRQHIHKINCLNLGIARKEGGLAQIAWSTFLWIEGIV